MARQGISTGTSPNDGLGDSLLAGAVKINQNFLEIYNTFGNGNTLTSYVNTAGIATYATTSGVATISGYATTAGVATYSSSSGVSTTVSGGFGSLIGLTVVGLTTLSVNSSIDALRITQTGGGNALVVEDETNPDATPVIVTGIGSVGIGTNSPVCLFHVQGDTLITGIATVGLANTSTPVNNSQMSFELTSDTNLRIKVRGTDGVLRSADITLA